MTDKEQKQQLTPEQEYMLGVLNKFNANPEDPTLSNAEKVLMGRILSAKQMVASLTKQMEDLNTTITKCQNDKNILMQQLLFAEGQSQGYEDSLLALK